MVVSILGILGIQGIVDQRERERESTKTIMF